ncbi:Cysteine proteinase [Plasmodiophora brassicae]
MGQADLPACPADTLYNRSASPGISLTAILTGDGGAPTRVPDAAIEDDLPYPSPEEDPVDLPVSSDDADMDDLLQSTFDHRAWFAGRRRLTTCTSNRALSDNIRLTLVDVTMTYGYAPDPAVFSLFESCEDLSWDSFRNVSGWLLSYLCWHDHVPPHQGMIERHRREVVSCLQASPAGLRDKFDQWLRQTTATPSSGAQMMRHCSLLSTSCGLWPLDLMVTVCLSTDPVIVDLFLDSPVSVDNVDALFNEYGVPFGCLWDVVHPLIDRRRSHIIALRFGTSDVVARLGRGDDSLPVKRVAALAVLSTIALPLMHLRNSSPMLWLEVLPSSAVRVSCERAPAPMIMVCDGHGQPKQECTGHKDPVEHGDEDDRTIEYLERIRDAHEAAERDEVGDDCEDPVGDSECDDPDPGDAIGDDVETDSDSSYSMDDGDVPDPSNVDGSDDERIDPSVDHLVRQSTPPCASAPAMDLSTFEVIHLDEFAGERFWDVFGSPRKEAFCGRFRFDLADEARRASDAHGGRPRLRPVFDVDSLQAITTSIGTWLQHFPVHEAKSFAFLHMMQRYGNYRARQSDTGSSVHDLRVQRDDEKASRSVAQLPRFLLGQVDCHPMANVSIFLIAAAPRWTHRSLKQHCSRAVSAAFSACQADLPDEINDYLNQFGAHRRPVVMPPSSARAVLEALEDELDGSIMVLMQALGVRSLMKMTCVADVLEVRRYLRTFWPSTLMDCARFDIGSNVSAEPFPDNTAVAVCRDYSALRDLDVGCGIAPRKSSYYPVGEVAGFGGCKSRCSSVMASARSCYNATVSQRTRDRGRVLVDPVRFAHIGTLNAAVRATFEKGKVRKSIAGLPAALRKYGPVKKEDVKRALNPVRDAMRKRIRFCRQMAAERVPVVHRVEYVANLTMRHACFNSMWQEADGFNDDATFLLLDAEAVWAHLRRKLEQYVVFPRKMYRAMFRRLERGRRSPFVSNIDRRSLNALQIFEDCFNAVFDGSSINPGRFYHRATPDSNVGPWLSNGSPLDYVSSSLQFGRFFVDDTYMDPLALVINKGEFMNFIQSLDYVDMMSTVLRISVRGNRHALHYLVQSWFLVISSGLSSMLTPDAIALNLLQTEAAYTYDQLAKRKILAPGVWHALDRPDLDQEHDYLFAGFMRSLDALYRLGRRGSTLDPSLSSLPTVSFSNWIATNWMSPGVERLPHRALWRDVMSIIPESRYDDYNVTKALVERVKRTRDRQGRDGIHVTLLLRWSGRVIHPFVALVDPPPDEITDEYVSDLMGSATKTVAQRRAMRARPDGRWAPSSRFLAVLAHVVMIVPPLHDRSAVVRLPASSDPMTLSTLPLAPRSVTLFDACKSWRDVPLPSANQGSKKRHWLWEALALIQGVLHSSPDARGACTKIDWGSFLADPHNGLLVQAAGVDAVVHLSKGHRTMSTQVHAAVKGVKDRWPSPVDLSTWSTAEKILILVYHARALGPGVLTYVGAGRNDAVRDPAEHVLVVDDLLEMFGAARIDWRPYKHALALIGAVGRTLVEIGLSSRHAHAYFVNAFELVILDSRPRPMAEATSSRFRGIVDDMVGAYVAAIRQRRGNRADQADEAVDDDAAADGDGPTRRTRSSRRAVTLQSRAAVKRRRIAAADALSMSSSEDDSDDSSRDTSELCQSTSRESQKKRSHQGAKRRKLCGTTTRPVRPLPVTSTTVIKDPPNTRTMPPASAQTGHANRRFTAPKLAPERTPGGRASRPAQGVNREPVKEEQSPSQERDAGSLLPAGISNNDAAGVCRSICYAIAPVQILRSLPGWERVSGPAPWIDLYNKVMNPRLDLHAASDILVDLIKAISDADRATRSFDPGQQHDADDFALELLQQMQAYEVVGALGHPIERAIIGFVEHVVDACKTCGHVTRRPPCELPVVMLGGSHGRTSLADALLLEHTTTIARRCTAERPCNRGQDVEHRSTTDPIEIVQEPGLDGQTISMARRKTAVDVVPQAVFQVGDAYFQLVGLVDHWGNAHVAGHDEGHYVSWVKQARGGWAFCDTSRVQGYSDAHVADLLSKRVYRLLFYRCFALRRQ